MSPEEISKSYDSLADHWYGDHFPRDNGIEQHRRALGFADHGGNALDIGCGCSGRILDLLLQHGFAPEGLDVSKKMIELAKSRHPQITFHHADICRWEFSDKYDFISAWDSIWHIPLQQHESVLSKILAALSPGGVCIFTTGGVEEPSETLDAAMGPQMYHSAPGIPAILEIIAKSGSACRHLEYDQWPELHVYVIVQKLENTE